MQLFGDGSISCERGSADPPGNRFNLMSVPKPRTAGTDSALDKTQDPRWNIRRCDELHALSHRNFVTRSAGELWCTGFNCGWFQTRR